MKKIVFLFALSAFLFSGCRIDNPTYSFRIKVTNPDEVGHDKVIVRSARLLPSGKEVFLEIADLAPVMQMKISFDLETVDGEEMIGDLHNTIHVLAEDYR